MGQTVAFIGMGLMGRRMARNVLAKGLGDLDQTATIRVLEEIVGLQVRRPQS